MIDIMTRTQIQFPEPLYLRLKEIAERQDWSLSEVMRKAAEQYVTRFPEGPKPKGTWRFPTLDCGGDYRVDPALLRPEADAMLERSTT
jgi:Ribbon-helix-helix protein, copG family